MVLQIQELQRGQPYGRLGRLVAERAVIFRDVVPAVLVPCLNAPLYAAQTLGEKLDWSRGYVGAASIVAAIAVYLGMAKATKKCLLPRPVIEADPPNPSY